MTDDFTSKGEIMRAMANLGAQAIDDPSTWVVSITMNETGRIFTQYMVWSEPVQGELVLNIGRTIRACIEAVRKFRPERLFTSIFIKHPDKQNHVTCLCILNARELVRASEMDYITMPNPESPDDKFVMFSDEKALDIKETIFQNELGDLLIPEAQEKP